MQADAGKPTDATLQVARPTMTTVFLQIPRGGASAHLLWLARKNNGGRPRQHWMDAEERNRQRARAWADARAKAGRAKHPSPAATETNDSATAVGGPRAALHQYYGAGYESCLSGLRNRLGAYDRRYLTVPFPPLDWSAIPLRSIRPE
ncbi:hypothetical protein CPLU01_03996 [Colletotrichum plurivorum]|uniref:Uncharacterized protein n=1 Tax=Colletotrichum plurivorum TaxID=2175906 RepID=A0A8H6NK90_9PEZI|nr:hypothetical protein CPLU01_03996 [Colletotrichum plurivorum]